MWQAILRACDAMNLRWNFIDCGDVDVDFDSEENGEIQHQNDEKSRIVFLCRYVDDFFAITVTTTASQANGENGEIMDPVNYAFDRLVEKIHNDSPEPSLVFTTNSNTDSIGFLVDVMAVDRLHGFDLGVQKYLFQLWFDSSNHKEECYVPPNLQTSISNRLVKIKPPSNITRLPRPLSERSFWKGSEYLNFLHVVITTSGALERLFCF